jgi:hypothetical protein
LEPKDLDDAICIKQDDNVEKNYKIPLMRHIPEAKFVAWPGRAPEDLASSWEFAKQLPFILKDISGASGPARLQWYGPPPGNFGLLWLGFL